jgi:NADH-quinone oxidoreductase subunit A
MLTAYLPIFILMALAILFALGALLLSSLVGPRNPNPVKLAPYECGITPVGSARQRFPVKFYLVAMLFIVFDIEIVFLYPWAVVYREFIAQGFGLFALAEMGIFVGVLLAGLVYVWRKGGLDWD